MTDHRLEGLEPDNLLAFLALLGLLRALETAEPGWRPRVRWDGVPLRPVLTTAAPTTPDAVAEAAARGCGELAKDYDFEGEANLTFDRVRARSFLETAVLSGARLRCALLDALFSDGAVGEKGKVLATPLCAMFGQGHQHFLGRLETVPKGILPKSLAKQKRPPDLNAPHFIHAALFVPWTREDETDSFRWDPAEDRRYALRFENPSGDAGRTVHGANRLAAIGIPALPGTTIERRGGVRFLMVGAAYGTDNLVEITWPAPQRPASLCALRALMAHPALSAAAPDPATLRRLGLRGAWRTRRISVGKYFNFTRAEPL